VGSIPDLMAPMERAEITDIVHRAGDLVAEHYVFADVGARLRDLLSDRADDRAYDALVDPLALAGVVTEDLQSLNGDLHLRLKHHREPVADPQVEADQLAAVSAEAARALGGIARIERLDGNVAHLALAPALFPVELVGDALTAALHVVAGADALLLDLRDNHGGDPRTVALVCGHLLDEQTHLVTMQQRDPDKSIQSWSPAWVPGPRFGASKPVFVLVGPQTFSGAEELAYDLQVLERAAVVGERTRGGAHPRDGFRLHPHLELTVPVARAVSAITGGNWEGTGITPDVEVPAADALDTAHRLALTTLGRPD
jgi:Peptidase family S41/N-terminal domain of Peptidase_S41 in eukaryotic IRBP